jgi:hypothetical protein
MALKDPNKAQVRRAKNEGKRLNFWSSFNAKPKPQNKFLVRFGDNGLFYSGGQDGELDIDFSRIAAFSKLNAIPNLAWMVKSVTRPSMNIPMKDAMYEQDGEIIGLKPPSIDAVTWVPITIKLVNVANHTFYPNETTTKQSQVPTTTTKANAVLKIRYAESLNSSLLIGCYFNNWFC